MKIDKSNGGTVTMSKSKLNELTIVYPDQLWLEFSEQEQKAAWHMEQNYSNNPARWNAYINRICINPIINWFQEEFELEELPSVGLNESDTRSIWNVVNGTAITLQQTRIVIIPTEAIDTEEFSVPQEWIDIPSWVASYYLAVQVNLHDHWIRIWGYATHRQFKNQGTYDPSDRTYSLDREDVIEDLNVMWLSRKRNLEQKAQVKEIPKISANEADILLKQLAKPLDYSPRLDVPFEKWAAIIEDNYLRKQLHESQIDKVAVNIPTAILTSSPIKVKLSDWLQNSFNVASELGWQTIEAFLSPEKQRLAFRSGEAPIKQGKLIDLGVQLGGKAIVLLVAIASEADEKVGIRVQAHPADDEKYLPPNLKLALLSDIGENIQTVQSRLRDNYIQLNPLKGEKGDSFGIRLSLGDASITEPLEV